MRALILSLALLLPLSAHADQWAAQDDQLCRAHGGNDYWGCRQQISSARARAMAEYQASQIGPALQGAGAALRSIEEPAPAPQQRMTNCRFVGNQMNCMQW